MRSRTKEVEHVLSCQMSSTISQDVVYTILYTLKKMLYFFSFRQCQIAYSFPGSHTFRIYFHLSTLLLSFSFNYWFIQIAKPRVPTQMTPLSHSPLFSRLSHIEVNLKSSCSKQLHLKSWAGCQTTEQLR